jgi:hypothetical protein
MQLDLCFISSTLTISSQFILSIFTIFTMMYGIIFGCNLSNSKKIFTLQKKIVGLMADVNPRNSCRSLFKR